MEHTRTPWIAVTPKPHGAQITSEDGFISVISNSKDKELDKINAKFIVKAVNCHDELVEALNIVRSRLTSNDVYLNSIVKDALAKAEEK
jgi:hypothetical protein